MDNIYKNSFENFFKNLFKSWLESIKFFSPENLKIFFLITIKTFLGLCKNIRTIIFLILLGFVWLGEFLIFDIILGNTDSPYIKEIINNLSDVFLFSTLYLFYIVFFLEIRASVENKNSKYIIKNLLFCFPIICLIIFIIKYINSKINIDFNLFYFPEVFYIIFILFFFFLLDSQKNLLEIIKAFGRSIIMFIYNLPIFFIIILILKFLFNIFNFNILNFENTGDSMFIVAYISILLLLILSFIICLISNLYIKKVHEQFGLYYKT